MAARSGPVPKIAPPPAGLEAPGTARRLLGSAVLAWVAWSALGHLRDVEASSLLGLVDYGVHEFGHLCFGIFGSEWLAVAGGSIMSLLIPSLVALLFWRQRERLGVAVCAGWLAIALARMAWYMADARVLELDLVSFSPDASGHDWNYLFKSVGLISHDTAIAGTTRALGWLLLAGGTAWGLWDLWRGREPSAAPA